jgi:hypothetical protein
LIAVDTSTLIAYLAGEAGRDTDALDSALARDQAHLPPVVLTEILSAPSAPGELAGIVLGLPVLPILDGYWERAGLLRRRLRARGAKAALADSLICQSCLDHGVSLLTRDGDFNRFAKVGGFKLA